jgi:signal transduction histidine kinase
MDDWSDLPARWLGSRRLAFAVMGLMVALLAAIIFSGAARQRHSIRAQIAGRDAVVLHAVAQAQQLTDEANDELGGEIENVTDQFSVALQISRFKGVIAARLFDPNGRFLMAFPANVTTAALVERDVAALRQLTPVSRFEPDVPLSTVFHPPPSAAASPRNGEPLLEVVIPFHRKDQTNLLGAVQFVMNGQGIAAEFAALDHSLFRQAAVAFAGGTLLVVLTLGWAFRRLQAVNRQLVERTASLLRANEELALAAKTSAVGAVTSHLIHGLSSPLTGLQNFVAQRSGKGPGTGDTDWQHAVTLTQQMQTMIGEIVRVLREHQGVQHYELTLSELAQIVAARVEPIAQQAGVQFTLKQTGEGALANREANLVLLILDNLVKNALEATSAGRIVELAIQATATRVKFEVRDEGPGVPAAVREHLFQPCRSTKPGGSGIGLAICKQLAGHLGAELELTGTAPQGSLFTLTMPLAVAPAANRESPPAA